MFLSDHSRITICQRPCNKLVSATWSPPPSLTSSPHTPLTRPHSLAQHHTSDSRVLCLCCSVCYYYSVMVHQVDSPTVHLPPTVRAAGKGTVEEYDSPEYEGAGGDELLPGSPPARERSFSAHYDELFELSTDSDDDCDDKPLDSAEVRLLKSTCFARVWRG